MKKGKIIRSVALLLVASMIFLLPTDLMAAQKTTVTYADVDAYDAVYLSYSQLIEWVKYKSIPYEELVYGDGYAVHIQILDKNNQSTANTTNNKNTSVGKAIFDGALEGAGDYFFDEYIYSDDYDIDRSALIYKTVIGAAKNGTRQYLDNKKSATTQNTKQINVDIIYYFVDKKSSCSYAEMYRVLQNNDKFIYEIVDNCTQQTKHPEFYARKSSESVWGKVLYLLPSLADDEKHYLIYLVPYTTYNSLSK